MADLQEIAVNQQELIEACKESPDMLSALATPEMYEFAWPPLYIALWAWLREQVDIERAFQRLALGLPRGFAKTTFIKLFLLYCILFTKRRFILVLAATATMAENIVADVMDMLGEPNVKATFGDWKLSAEKDTNAVKKFSFRGRPIIIAALGAGGSVRGLNLKNARPDVMVFDDIQSREDADSEQVSSKLLKWLIGTAMKAKAPSGCLTIFIGNMYPTPHSILRKLKANRHWVKFIVGGILANGESLWEALQPVKQLLEEYQADLEAGHPEIFHAEVLNDENAAVNNLVDFSRLPEYPYPDYEPHGGNFIIIDPANDKANSDAVAIGYFEVHEGKPTLREVVAKSMSPGETIMCAINLGTRWNCPVIFGESNAYQYSLKYWFETKCTELGILGFEFVPIYSGSMSKNSRILTTLKSYVAGEIYVHPDCKAQVHHQITNFNPTITKNVDDILDLLTYSARVVTEFGHLLRVSTIEATQDFEASYQDDEFDVSRFSF